MADPEAQFAALSEAQLAKLRAAEAALGENVGAVKRRPRGRAALAVSVSRAGRGPGRVTRGNDASPRPVGGLATHDGVWLSSPRRIPEPPAPVKRAPRRG